MNTSSSSRFGAGLIALGSCIFLLAIAAYGVYLRPEGIVHPTDQTWEGYELLLVETSVSEREVEGRLEAAGSGEVLSREDILLSYCEFPGLGTVPLTGAPMRFDDADPRYDAYMRTVGNYFSSRDGRYSLYYCEETEVSLAEIAAEAFGGTSIEHRLFMQPRDEVAEVRLQGIVTAVVILLFGAFLGYLVKRFLPLIGMTALICGGMGFFTGPGVLPAALLFQFASAFFSRDSLIRYKRRLNESLSVEGSSPDGKRSRLSFPRNLQEGRFRRALLPIAAFTGGVGITLAEGAEAPVITVLVMAVAVAAVPLLRAGIMALTQAGQEHRLFFSVPLRRERNRRSRSLAAAALAASVVLAGVRLFMPFQSADLPSGAALPEIPLPGRPLDPKDIAVRPGEAPENAELPDLRNYLQHLSYQELYLYGGRDSLSTFSQEAGRIRKASGRGALIDEEWIRDRSADFAASPLGRLLVSESGPIRARYGAPAAAEPEESVPLFAVFVWLGVLLAGWYGSTPLTAGTLYGMKSIEPRRRRQAA